MISVLKVWAKLTFCSMTYFISELSWHFAWKLINKFIKHLQSWQFWNNTDQILFWWHAVPTNLNLLKKLFALLCVSFIINNIVGLTASPLKTLMTYIFIRHNYPGIGNIVKIILFSTDIKHYTQHFISCNIWHYLKFIPSKMLAISPETCSLQTYSLEIISKVFWQVQYEFCLIRPEAGMLFSIL